MFIEDRREFPKILSLKKPGRCANRCGRERSKSDIYCIPCRDQVTAEAWLLIKCEEPAHV